MKDLLSIVSHFQLTGTVQEIKPLGAGLINDTYKVTTLEADAPDYVLQRINHAIFQDVEMLQANINAVTTHIRRKLEGAPFPSCRQWKDLLVRRRELLACHGVYSQCEDIRNGQS